MRNKIIVFLFIFLALIFVFNVKSYAIMISFSISSNNYEIGEQMTEDEKNDIEVGKTLQLYGMVIGVNDMNLPDLSVSAVRFVQQTNLSGVIWTSSNNKIATVDNTGKVTGIAEGKTTITATYGERSADYEVIVKSKSNEVVEPTYSLSLSSKEYQELPSNLEIGNKMQLIVMLHNNVDSLFSEDVTSKGVIYTSSNENVVRVDDSGLVTAIGEGMVTITAKYKIGDETITAEHNLNVTDSTEEPAEPSTTETPKTEDNTTVKGVLPQTGKNITIEIIGIIAIVAVAVVSYKKYNEYKNIK